MWLVALYKDYLSLHLCIFWYVDLLGTLFSSHVQLVVKLHMYIHVICYIVPMHARLSIQVNSKTMVRKPLSVLPCAFACLQWGKLSFYHCCWPQIFIATMRRPCTYSCKCNGSCFTCTPPRSITKVPQIIAPSLALASQVEYTLYS